MNSKVKQLRGLALGLGFLAWGSFTEPGFPPDLPEILSFSIEPTTVQGQKGWIELSWQTSGATRVRLYENGREIKGRSQLPDGGFGWPTELDGGLKFEHEERSTYELLAENEEGKASKTVVVPEAGAGTKRQKPTIVSFSASPAKVKPGGFVKFFWQVEDAQEIRLYDDHGELDSVIQGSDGTFGWPALLEGSFELSENKTTTYRLVAANAAGESAKTFVVEVRSDATTPGNCTLVVSIRGRYGKYTETVDMFRSVSGRPTDLLSRERVRTVRDHRSGRDPGPFQRATITVPAGDFFLVPRGGGKDDHGHFAVMYKPNRQAFSCRAGAPSRLSFEADVAEY